MSRELIAYFTMEMALDPRMPTYSGGLGVLAGDTIRSASDLGAPLAGVTLLHRKGYMNQHLDGSGWQTESTVSWPVEAFLTEESPRVTVDVDGRRVTLRAWRFDVRGVDGHVVPVYLLDTDLPENSEWDRSLTDTLYGGDFYYRICQEVILGIGGVRMLRALGHTGLRKFHMNEGHAAFLTLELLDESRRAAGREAITRDDIDFVRPMCIFTTHTPVAAGHDKFSLDVATRVAGMRGDLLAMPDLFMHEGMVNMTYLALNLSYYVNGVAKRHGEVSRVMFPHYTIDAITNGVHAPTWVCPSFAALFDRYIPGWRQDAFSLRYALNIPRDEVWEAHMQAKRALIERVNRDLGADLHPAALTLGFARRMAPYKRGDLLLSDPDRLRTIAETAGPFQIVYAGKAHPGDTDGKEIIQRIFRARDTLKHEVKIVYIPNYDIEIAKLLVSGCDVWMNTPQRPLEASGTSGMKAAVNGVPSLSVLDGWWVEGHIEGVTGWSIGAAQRSGDERTDWFNDAQSIYGKLEHVILPLVSTHRHRYIELMRHCIALNGSFFNTHRMVQQYIQKAYFI